jgi:hypothetical protein
MAKTKPKKPAFNASSLPKGKGISAVPAKMRNASPNFVDERGITPVTMIGKRKYAEPIATGGPVKKDPGSNPGGSPVIKYKRVGYGSDSGKFQKLTNKGNFEYNKSKGCETEGNCPKPGYEVVGGGKKGTSASPKKPMAKTPSKKMVSAKKPMMKGTK